MSSRKKEIKPGTLIEVRREGRGGQTSERRLLEEEKGAAR